MTASLYMGSPCDGRRASSSWCTRFVRTAASRRGSAISAAPASSPRATARSWSHAPPMPTFTTPLPWHSGHAPAPSLPLPPQRGQTSSPVPGVPAGASSPGLIGAWALAGSSPGRPAGGSGRPGKEAVRSIAAPGSSSPATDSSRSSGRPIGALPSGGVFRSFVVMDLFRTGLDRCGQAFIRQQNATTGGPIQGNKGRDCVTADCRGLAQ